MRFSPSKRRPIKCCGIESRLHLLNRMKTAAYDLIDEECVLSSAFADVSRLSRVPTCSGGMAGRSTGNSNPFLLCMGLFSIFCMQACGEGYPHGHALMQKTYHGCGRGHGVVR